MKHTFLLIALTAILVLCVACNSTLAGSVPASPSENPDNLAADTGSKESTDIKDISQGAFSNSSSPAAEEASAPEWDVSMSEGNTSGETPPTVSYSPSDDTEYSDYSDPLDYFELPDADDAAAFSVTVEDGTVDISAEKIEITIHNSQAGTGFTYGYYYELEYFSDGEWSAVPFTEGFGFWDIACLAEDKGSFCIYPKNHVFDFTAGLYRVTVEAWYAKGALELQSEFYME